MPQPLPADAVAPLQAPLPHVGDALFAGPGEMRARCRSFDWSTTALGPVSGWSQSLRTTVGIVLGCQNPMFLWWGPELVQIYNDAYRPSFGLSGRHPTALGMRGRECWTDIWPVIGPQIEQVMTSGEPTWHEDMYLPIERNDTLEDVWWTYSYSPVHEDDGSIAGTLVVCMETTNRVRAEAALRKSESRYRRLFDSLDEGFCVIEMLFDDEGRPNDYRFVEANPAFVEQTGLEGALGRRVREFAPEHESHWFEVYGRVARTGIPIRFEAPAQALGRWYDAYAFRPGEAEPNHVAVLFRDVTATRAAELERESLLSALQVERARLEQVFDRAPSFITAYRGPKLVYEFVNEAYYQLVGQRDLIGRPLLEALPEIAGQGFDALLARVRETGEPWVGHEVPVLLGRTAGEPLETRYLSMVFQALVEADGSRSGVVAHGSDVTEQVLARRQVERLLQVSEQARTEAEQARIEAENANRAKGEFLAVMSHELRTPLNAIGGYAELMEMGIRGPLTKQQLDDLHRIQTSQRHLLGLINEVLNYAKLETGNVHYEISEVGVRGVLASAESLVAPQARARGLRLTLAECPADMLVHADPEKLRQILVNVLSNAVKFTEPGGRIAMSCERIDGAVAVSIRDTGIGIAADKLQAIFDPFVQVRSDLTRPHEGTGLGLAISRDLARGMGGELAVTSELGVGSTFVLTLPAAS